MLCQITTMVQAGSSLKALAEGGAQAEDGPRQRQHRGPGSRGSRGGSGGSRAKGGAEGTPAPVDGAQEGRVNAQAGGKQAYEERASRKFSCLDPSGVVASA